jgi:hypothetical protein
MFSAKLTVIGLLLIPTIASAQRGGSGGGSGRTRGDARADFNGVMNANAGGVKLSNRDVEDISPLKLLIDKRKDLALSEETVKSLKDLENQLKETNRDSFRALDSLRRLAQPPAREPTDDDRARMMDARRTVVAVVTTIRGNYDASLGQALALLDESQRTKANELVDKLRKDAEEMLREKLGGGRGGRG